MITQPESERNLTYKDVYRTMLSPTLNGLGKGNIGSLNSLHCTTYIQSGSVSYYVLFDMVYACCFSIIANSVLFYFAKVLLVEW